MSFILKEIEIENFKSYHGKHVIGPFTHFTAIVGPNGCGKSNLVDAISFVLGQKIKNLRVREQKDLIFGSHVNNYTNPNCQHTCVSARFLGTDEILTFTRKLTLNDDTYYLNDQQASRNKYLEFLLNININIKINNFMVLQNDVERILNENPKNLTCAFERFTKSISLKKQYETAQLNLKNEMLNFTHALKKKRDMTNQKRNLDMRKNEAGKYMEIKQSINIKLRDAHILKIKLINIEIKNYSNLANNLNDNLNNLKSQLRTLINDQGIKKSEAAKNFRRITAFERQLSDAELEYQKIKPLNLNILTKIDFLKNKINSDSKSIENINSQDILTNKRISELENSLHEAQSLLKILDTPPAERISKNLTPKQYNKYLKLRDKADKITNNDNINLNNLFNARETVLKQITVLNSSIVQFEKRLNIIKESANTLLSRLDKIKSARDKYNEILTEKRASFEIITKEINRAKEIKIELQLKLNTLNDKLSNYKINMADIERQKNLNNIIDKLKLLFNGVHGKLIDLINPINKRYHVAITKVVGRNIDAIVVDDNKIAFDCIEYLKQQQIGRFIFLPLKSLNPKPINEKLRLLGGTSKLLIDTVKFDNIYFKIAAFIFGNTIVCDDLDEALRLSIGLTARRKTVCIDGTLFLKNGIISGGSRSLARKAARFNDKNINDLKLERNNINTLIQNNIDIINKQKNLDELNLEIKSLLHNYNIYDMEIAQLQSSSDNLKHEENEIKNTIEKHNRDLTDYQTDLHNKNILIDNLENKIKSTKLNIFNKFIQKNNIVNFDEFESGSVKSMRELINRRVTCQKHIDILTNQLNYEKSQININKKDNILKIINDNKIELAQFEAENFKIEQDINYYTSKINNIKNELIKLRDLYDKINSNLREVTSEINGLEKNESEISAKLKTHEIKLEKLVNEKYQLLIECKTHAINLEINDNLRSFPEFLNNSQNTQELNDKNNLINYNSDKYFDILKINIDHAQSSNEYKNITEIDELNESIQTLNNAVDSLRRSLEHAQKVDLTILNDYDKLLEDVNKMSFDFNSVKNNVKNLQLIFDNIKLERKNLFMAGFNVVSNQIDNIYKSMCNDMSAHAYLTLEDADEPFLGGINYACVPPNKGFQNIQKLSGGEKSLAALALLFALQSIDPAPFMILDEVDAALDLENIKNLANYIRNQSRMEIPYLVISLKEDLFNKANSLIGVTSSSNSEIPMSKIFTLNLDRYSSD